MARSTTAEPAVTLTTGASMPLMGLGVWQVPQRETERVVAWALEDGYRHVDTAASYRNEEGVGRGIRASGVPREEVFVTTKLVPTRRDPERELRESLARLGLDYVDLYLIHWPAGGGLQHWPALERLHRQGLARAIGVSNYGVPLLERLLREAEVPPAVNQISWSPFDWSPRELEDHRRLGVVLEAYSPLGRGRALRDATVVAIAARVGRTPAQVLLRWAIEHGVPVIPKSRTRERIAENRRVFDFSLPPEEMALLDGMAR